MKLVDPDKYPLTTQAGLSEENQALIDAHNLTNLREAIELGETLSDSQEARLKELAEKEKIRMGDNKSKE